MKLILENWRKFTNEQSEKIQRLLDLTDDYLDIEHERLLEIAWQVDIMIQKGASIEALDLEFDGTESEYAKRFFALRKEMERKNGGDQVSTG